MTEHIRRFDLELHDGPLPSPCVGVCQMDQARGVCSGCLRTIEEIMAWSRADDAQKRAIWLLLQERAPQ